ncbi:hypothetical protein JW805_04710 [Roseomonas aeriglobus]|nr:hypothetical protein [Roseomonas aeriglobus]
MNDGLTFDQFVSITRDMAANEGDFLPTFVDPQRRDIVALDGHFDDSEIEASTRTWAEQKGATRYFIAFAWRGVIKAEEYRDGAIAATQMIELN